MATIDKDVIALKKEPEDLPVPGIGIAGQVICPLMSIGRPVASPCVKHMCEFWVELTYNSTPPRRVGRCSLAWGSILTAELRGSIDKLSLIAGGGNEREKSSNTGKPGSQSGS